MSIRQLNASYLVHEDRILFRFNTQDQSEYRFWFTRRVTLFILAATSHLLTKKMEQEHSPDAAKALNEFEKQAILGTAKHQNSSNQNYEPGLNFPLGFDPILVINITCALTKESKKLAYIEGSDEGALDDAISIDFALPGGANLNLKLAGSMMLAMSLLLDQLRQQAGWGDTPSVSEGSLVSEVAHDTEGVNKPSVH